MANYLGVNIITGWLRAYVDDSGGSERSWSCDDKVYSIEDIGDALRGAVKATNSKGYYLTVLLEHELLSQKTFDVPQMKAKDLRLFLKRKVDAEKEFEEEAVFSYTKTVTTKGTDAVSVNILPASFFYGLMDVALEAGLYLTQVTPMSSVVAHQFQKYSTKEDEMAALLLKLGDKINLVLGKSNGMVFSERTLKCDLDDPDDVERLSQEINRSLLHSKQQFGESVAFLNLTENFPQEFLNTLGENVNVPVNYIEKSGRFFWIKETLSMPKSHGSNLVTPQLRQGTYIRKFTKLAAASIAALWIISLSTLVTVEYLVYNEKTMLDNVQSQMESLRNRKARYEERNKELNDLSAAMTGIKAGTSKPVAGIFLANLANELPAGLVLNDAKISRDKNAWKVSMSGKSISSDVNVTEEVEKLSVALSEGPFHLNVGKSWYEKWFKDYWSNKLLTGQVGEAKPESFFIEGEIR